MDKITKISFKSPSDFRNRIAAFWQDQEEGEIYEFQFQDSDTENEFNELVKCFRQSQP